MVDESRTNAVFDRHSGYEDDPEAQDALWADLVSEVLSREVPFETHWGLFKKVYGDRPEEAGPPLVWRPGPEQAKASNLGRTMAAEGFDDYRTFHRWTADDRAGFWRLANETLGVRWATAPKETLDLSGGAKDPVWFPGATLNIVDSCFQAEDDAVAIVAAKEDDEALREVTYGELRTLVDRVAQGLRDAGFEEGDAVALYMPMTVECVAAYLGIVKAGMAAISIADSFAPIEVNQRLEIGDAAGVVTVDAFTRAGKTFKLYDKVKEAKPRRTIVIHDAGDTVDLRDGDLTWQDFLADEAAVADGVEASVGDPYRTSNILFSSGTTGTPKAIPWTHLTPIKCAVDGYFHQDVRPEDVLAWPTNIGWMMGPWLIYASLLNKAAMALHEGAPNTPDFCRFVERAKVTMLGLVPSLAKAWEKQEATKDVDWSALRVFSSTGEASNQKDYLWLMAQDDYRVPVIEYCGGTEVGGGHLTGTVVQPASPATFTTPALGLDVVAVDEAGDLVDEGGMGEIYIVPPSVGLSQTLLNKDHDEEYYEGVPPGPGGAQLRRHGDAIARLHNGFWQAQGRADDTMNLGGIKVSSLELERLMDRHDAVYQSAAVAVTPPEGGSDRLVVFVVPEGDPGAVDQAALKQELQGRIADELNPLFRVKDLVLVDELPRTASNKIMRRKLRSRYQEKMEAAA